ncbi:MAG: Nramp family divalent metal transporter [Candidatus Paceibacterota bacterium]|jgi:NRAMP (natural resistance-associated macrophage protein)-like metal ion transporter
MKKNIEATILKDAEAYWEKLGPGLTTGAADDDPSGIATYSQTGAKYGLSFLWLAILTYPLMAVVQEMCARIGIVTGRGLAATIRHNYPKWILYFLTAFLFAANTFNIGADLGAMAAAIQLLIPQFPFWSLVIGFTLLSLYFQIFTSYRTYAKYLKWLALVLFSYVITAFGLRLNWGEIFYHTFIPQFSLNKESLLLVAAVLGTTISPYLFFWQPAQEIEEKILHGENTVHKRRKVATNEIKNMRVDVWSGMFVSNIVMFFIIIVCSFTLFSNGITNINTASEAALALRPLAGDGAYLLFALGIIGSGLLSIPILAGSASYAISETFNWRLGLYHKFKQAWAFYGVIIASMIVGLLLNFIGLDPIKALIYSAVGNCIVAPFALFFIVIISSSKKIMGEEHVNKPFTTFLGWVTVVIMALTSIGTLLSFFI